MLGRYKLSTIENGPITAISSDLYIVNIPGALYLNIENPKSPFEVIGSIYVPRESYKEIIDNLSKYNKRLSYSYGVRGNIVDISYRRYQDNKLEENIKGKPVEILPDHDLDLDDKIEMITNNWNLYQLANNGEGLKMIVKIPIFQDYQRLHL
jgi:hypothetical protein